MLIEDRSFTTHQKVDWLDTLFAIKHRTVTLILASLIFTFIGPLTAANANDSATPITIYEVQGVTPPVAGATPVSAIQENEQYTGSVTWSTYAGPHEGNFVSNTIYQATITIQPKTGYTFENMQDDFTVDGTYFNFNNFDSSSGELIVIFQPIPLDGDQYLDSTFGSDGSLDLKDIFGDSPQNESNTATSAVKVDQIAVDSHDRIVVLASFDSIRFDQYNDTYTVDNHILFRLNSNGSYDNTFGESSNALFKVGDPDPKYYVEVTTTGVSYIERLKLEIDNQDRILVMLSGNLPGSPGYHSFLARYTSNGILDSTFGDGEPGVIGTLSAIPENPEILFADFTIDSLNRIVIVCLKTPQFGEFSEFPEIVVLRFSPQGTIDESFFRNSPNETSTVFLDVNYPQLTSSPDNSEVYTAQPSPFRQAQIISTGDAGYIVSYSDSNISVGSSDTEEGFLFTQLFKLDTSGNLDESFVTPENPFESYPDNKFIIPFFFLTDLKPDRNLGFFISGTNYQIFYSIPDFYSLPFFGVVARFNIDGNVDTDFTGESDNFLLSPYISQLCYNVASLQLNHSDLTTAGVVSAEACAQNLPGEAKLKSFSSSGVLKSELSLSFDPQNFEEIFVTQLEATSDGKVLVLRGAKPTQGLVGYILQDQMQSPSQDVVYVPLNWSNVSILRLQIPDSSTPIAPPAPPTPVVQIPAPTPIPYLTTLTTPKINLRDGKLICTPGTYNAGYTLNGVAQGSTTAPFTPGTYTYNLLINGIAQIALAVTSSNPSNSWSMPQSTPGALITCSVTVTANGLTNSDRSSDNTSGSSAALATQTAAIAAANTDYSAALATNTKAYQKALVDNRAQWRISTEKIRTDYYAERDRIKSLPSTKTTRALSSVALKSYTTAIKLNAADYKASQPAALVAKEAADKAALAAKTAAIAKANATYGSFIESIGYGVLIP